MNYHFFQLLWGIITLSNLSNLSTKLIDQTFLYFLQLFWWILHLFWCSFLFKFWLWQLHFHQFIHKFCDFFWFWFWGEGGFISSFSSFLWTWHDIFSQKSHQFPTSWPQHFQKRAGCCKHFLYFLGFKTVESRFEKLNWENYKWTFVKRLGKLVNLLNLGSVHRQQLFENWEDFEELKVFIVGIVFYCILWILHIY